MDTASPLHAAVQNGEAPEGTPASMITRKTATELGRCRVSLELRMELELILPSRGPSGSYRTGGRGGGVLRAHRLVHSLTIRSRVHDELERAGSLLMRVLVFRPTLAKCVQNRPQRLDEIVGVCHQGGFI